MILTIGNEKGGVGKSRVATQLAALAAYDGVDVVMLDTDTQGSATSWSRIRNQETLSPAISVLSLPPSPAKELVELSSKYDLIIVDIGAQNYRTMMDCALLSDLVLVPCGPDQQEIESTTRVFDALKKMGPRHELGHIPAYVLLTRVSPQEASKATADLRSYFADESIAVFNAPLAHRSAWLSTGKSGRALHELKGKERSQKAVDEIRAVYSEVQSRLKPKSRSRGHKKEL